MALFAVIGLGSFGGAIALELTNLNHDVIGIDTLKKNVENFADQISHAVIADATDEHVLDELNVKNCDAVVVAIGDDEGDSQRLAAFDRMLLDHAANAETRLRGCLAGDDLARREQIGHVLLQREHDQGGCRGGGDQDGADHDQATFAGWRHVAVSVFFFCRAKRPCNSVMMRRLRQRGAR